jgi:diadenosine tetraphosphate (Ap4A) HIT family hydrolase
VNDFVLDQQLAEDCHVLGELDAGLLLLLNNALVPWFILVPVTEASELYQLDEELQRRVWHEISRLSEFVQDSFAVEKLNVAAIGNKVRQLHIHIVGRHPGDYCWPEVVWGAEGRVDYSPEQVRDIVSSLEDAYRGRFTAAPTP